MDCFDYKPEVYISPKTFKWWFSVTLDQHERVVFKFHNKPHSENLKIDP